MADILKIYTAEQLLDMYRLYLLAKGTGLTDFNEGSKTNTLIESNSDIISSIAMDFKEGITKAIPIAMYEGFGFDRLDAVNATGFMRPYRLPAFWIKYTGSGTSAKLTSTATSISTLVTGAPGDVFTFTYAAYPTLTDLVTAIDGEANWEATLVKSGTIASSTLYQYTSDEVVDAVNYLYGEGLDIMLNSAVAIAIPQGFSVTIDEIQIITTVAGTILAGDSGVQIAAQSTTSGTSGNIIINAVDTLNGKGSINSSISGVEQAINDTAFSGGKAKETATEREVRFSETVNALNAGTENGITSEIKKITTVRSVGMRTSFPFKGTNTIIVDDGTSTISASLLADIEKRLYGDPTDSVNFPGKDAAGILYIIEAPTIVDVNISITVYKLSTTNVDNSTIETAVQSALEQYVNTRKLGEDVILSEIISVATNAHSGVYDALITSPASNISISENEFAKTGVGTGGNVTVTVVTL
jgi:uncharacterized phage protein gp47/JayE